MISVLRCPHCHRQLEPHGVTWRCAAGHSFDIARQGYVNLAVHGPAHTGDAPEMLDARAAVLAAGHLDVVTAAVIDACAGLPPGAVVEAGAGTAHHLTRVARALGGRTAVAIDSSVAAAKRAARAGGSTLTAVVADVWKPWPLLDDVAAAVLTIFSPRNPAETARVLVPEGLAVVVTPAQDHLGELTAVLGLLKVEVGKRERLVVEMDAHFDPVDTCEVRTTRVLDRDMALMIARMGPTAHHFEAGELAARAARLPEQIEVTVAVHVSRFRPRTA
jgi:23S rRNA (guanine745-N1)-methyltransferase